MVAIRQLGVSETSVFIDALTVINAVKRFEYKQCGNLYTMTNLGTSMKPTIVESGRLGLILLWAVALTACGSNPSIPTAPRTVNPSAQTTGITTQGSADLEVDPNSVAGRAPTERIIYFDFDTSEVRPEYVDIIVQHGRFLAQNPDGRVRLEGHTDERGSREYNIALGERRAQSIGRLLQLQGVSNTQNRSISFGEELPLDENHTPDAWAKNRRVQIIYENQVPN